MAQSSSHGIAKSWRNGGLTQGRDLALRWSRWHSLPAMASPRAGAMVASLKDEIWLCGGLDGTDFQPWHRQELAQWWPHSRTRSGSAVVSMAQTSSHGIAKSWRNGGLTQGRDLALRWFRWQ